MAEEEGTIDTNEENLEALFDLKNKKKKSKAKTKTAKATPVNADVSGENQTADGTEKINSAALESTTETSHVSPETEYDPPIYTYLLLLERVNNLIQKNNPDLTEKKRFTMPPPVLMKVGTKRTVWVNFPETCNTLRRTNDHVFQFIMAELGTDGSIDGNKRLVMKGNFKTKQIESLEKKYIELYVKDPVCGGFNTALTKDSVSRLYFVTCHDCGSSHSVQQIRTGFHAQTKADRKAIRNTG